MADLKGNLTEYKSRRKKLNVMKLAVVLIAVGVILYFAVSAVKIVNLTIEKNRVETENERLRNQKEDLEQKLEIVNSNDYLESLARNKLRLVKGNEILFVLPSFRSAPEDEQLTPEEELFRLRLKEAEEKAMRDAENEKKAKSGDQPEGDMEGESPDATDGGESGDVSQGISQGLGAAGDAVSGNDSQEGGNG
ncbi:MAG: septum formation initiator family protein [Firmicutes bacterium]|nr:septum formation initiator family protein [Bacillota bacterium]MBQ1715395.1 septum formation initiator family protein [Bacillota bacterium]MBQ1825417.1 septum formation initiator family protein [Bacillota bacterium]MBQ2305736.1 septum formation initiator family protein [Bacillota bacterium]